jgi:mRNA interferase MazF
LYDWPLFRITIEPSPSNGLHKPSQIMVDKAATVPKAKIRQRIGQADRGTLQAVNVALGRFLDLI